MTDVNILICLFIFRFQILPKRYLVISTNLLKFLNAHYCSLRVYLQQSCISISIKYYLNYQNMDDPTFKTNTIAILKMRWNSSVLAPWCSRTWNDSCVHYGHLFLFFYSVIIRNYNNFIISEQHCWWWAQHKFV